MKNDSSENIYSKAENLIKNDETINLSSVTDNKQKAQSISKILDLKLSIFK